MNFRDLIEAKALEVQGIKKGQLWVSDSGVQAKVIKVEDDINIRVELLTGVNKGKKLRYDPKILKKLYKLEEAEKEEMNRYIAMKFVYWCFNVAKKNEKVDEELLKSVQDYLNKNLPEDK